MERKLEVKMLLKKISKYDDLLNQYANKPHSKKPLTVFTDFFGHEIVLYLGKLYSFPVEDAPFDPSLINEYFMGESIRVLTFKIIETLKNSTDEPIQIDDAYGYAINKIGKFYIASDTNENIRKTEIDGYIHSRNLEALYNILYREHIRNIEVYVHTGLPKTATTYLQKNVFPYLKNVHYISKYGDNEFFNKYFLKIRFGNNIIIENEIKQNFLEYLRFVDERKILISEEALSEPRNNGRHFWPNTQILSKIFPSVKIIFTIRYQIDFIESFYLQDLKVGSCLGIDAFLRYSKKEKYFLEFESTLVPKISVFYLDYQKFISLYIELFGKNNVKVMIYEQFKQSKKEFISDLCNFIGTKLITPISEVVEHRSYTRETAYCALWLNRLTYSNDGRLGIIVEKPFVKTLDGMLEFINTQLNKTIIRSHKKYIYKALRVVFRILRKLFFKITVQNISGLIDSFFRHTRIGTNHKIIDKEKTIILKDLYNKMNKDLDEMYSLNLNKFNYYE